MVIFYFCHSFYIDYLAFSSRTFSSLALKNNQYVYLIRVIILLDAQIIHIWLVGTLSSGSHVLLMTSLNL